MFQDGVTVAKDAIIDRVRRGTSAWSERDPLSVWYDLRRLLSRLELEEERRAAAVTSYRCIGGPKDGERLALPPNRFEFHVAKMSASPLPFVTTMEPEALMSFETLTYTLRTHRLTGEKAFVFQGLEHWS